jgi:hypothetical protein
MNTNLICCSRKQIVLFEFCHILRAFIIYLHIMIFPYCVVMRHQHILSYMRSEVVTAVKMSMLVFWVVTPCWLACGYQLSWVTNRVHFTGTLLEFYFEDVGDTFLRNYGNHLQDYKRHNLQHGKWHLHRHKNLIFQILHSIYVILQLKTRFILNWFSCTRSAYFSNTFGSHNLSIIKKCFSS